MMSEQLDDRVAASHEALRAKLAEVERERDEAVSRSERVSSFAATLIGNACERHSAEIAVMGFHEFQQVQPKSCHWCCEAERDRLAAEVDRLKAGFVVDGETSDGYHTFNELYAYRKALHALLANEWARRGLYDVHKSWRHSDGELCFGGGWFIVVAELPEGQVSNHYKAADWSLFQVPERERGNTYDGHTPAIALERLLARAALAEAPIPAREEGQ